MQNLTYQALTLKVDFLFRKTHQLLFYIHPNNLNYNHAKEILTTKIDDLHKIAKALLTYETLTGEEIEDIINKNKYPETKQDLAKDDDNKDSALGSIGLKPKIVH